MRATPELLFEEFAARYARGEHPDVRDYLERAGHDRDAFVALVDGYLASTPAQPPSEETRATFAELLPGDAATPTMLAARVQLGLPRGDVVRKLMEWLALPPEKEDKLARYYHELETGLLDPKGVQPAVWHNLAKIFGTGIRALMLRPNEPPPVMVAAYYRRSEDAVRASAAPPALARMVATEPERDEVDMLFTGNA
jgi:hypothetical protein